MASGAENEWVNWEATTREARADVAAAVERFEPMELPAGEEAAAWLQAHGADPGCRTRLLITGGELAGFHALTMGQVELRSSHQQTVGAAHPRQGAVLLAWIARSRTSPGGTGEQLFLDALDRARRAVEFVGAAVLALDPYDEALDRYWRQRYGFRASQTEARNGLKRLWLPIPATETAA